MNLHELLTVISFANKRQLIVSYYYGRYMFSRMDLIKKISENNTLRRFPSGINDEKGYEMYEIINSNEYPNFKNPSFGTLTFGEGSSYIDSSTNSETRKYCLVIEDIFKYLYDNLYNEKLGNKSLEAPYNEKACVSYLENEEETFKELDTILESFLLKNKI